MWRLGVACLLVVCDGATFNVKDYGAKGDGKTVDTTALRAALLAASKAGGGTVLFPNPGTYLTAPLNISSNVVVSLPAGATILGVADKHQYPVIPPLPSYGSSRDKGQATRYQALIGSFFADSVKILGGGTIDGNGNYWWSNRDHLSVGRPRLVEFYNSSNVEIGGVTLKDSGFWTLHPVYCRGVYIHDLNIQAPSNSPNTDGIDPDSSRDVMIERCSVACGDDVVAIKSGLNAAGRAVGLPSANITVRNCEFHAGHGLSIGSETSGGISDIFIYNNHMHGPTSHGVNIKTAPARGGVIKGITYLNNTIDSVGGAALLIGMNYDSSPPAPVLPTLSNVHYESISGSGSSNCGEFQCLSNSPCHNISFVNVDMKSCGSAWKCDHVATFSVENVQPSGLSSCLRG